MSTSSLIELRAAAEFAVKHWNNPASKRLLREAIAVMGTEVAVKSSTEQEEFGTAPEAAGLEPKCAQPVPARSEISVVDSVSDCRAAYTAKYGAYFHPLHYDGFCGAYLLKLPEPVSVSLEKCAMAAAANDYSEADYPAFEDVGLFAAQNWPMFKEITKAVLDAAGVAYVD